MSDSTKVFSFDLQRFATVLNYYATDDVAKAATGNDEAKAGLYAGTTAILKSNDGNYYELKTAGSYELGGDISIAQALDVYAKITLDLKGYSFTTSYKNGIWLNSNTSLVVNDTGGTGSISATGTTDGGGAIIVYPGTGTASLTVNGGTITGYSYGISGNGTADKGTTTITINGGTIKATKGTGIYHPQEGTLTIKDGTIEGTDSGIEIRSGELEVTGGTIEGGSTFETKANGSGTTTKGAAIAIAQHTTKKQIDVKITKIDSIGSSLYGIVLTNPQSNTDGEAVTLDVSTDAISTIGEGKIAVHSAGGAVTD